MQVVIKVVLALASTTVVSADAIQIDSPADTRASASLVGRSLPNLGCPAETFHTFIKADISAIGPNHAAYYTCCPFNHNYLEWDKGSNLKCCNGTDSTGSGFNCVFAVSKVPEDCPKDNSILPNGVKVCNDHDPNHGVCMKSPTNTCGEDFDQTDPSNNPPKQSEAHRVLLTRRDTTPFTGPLATLTPRDNQICKRDPACPGDYCFVDVQPDPDFHHAYQTCCPSDAYHAAYWKDGEIMCCPSCSIKESSWNAKKKEV